MLKIYINNEEVIANQNFTIQKHMLNTPSVILNNVCPKTWCDEKDYITNFYHPLDYSKCKIVDETFHPYDPGITTTINQSATLNNVDTTKLYELTQIEGNTTQSGTPTPSSPQPINVVSGRQEVDIVGKNLFDKDNTIYAYINSSGNVVKDSSHSNALSDYIEIDQNTNYVFSANTRMNGLNVAFFDSQKQFTSRKMGQSANYNSFDTESNSYIRVWSNFNSSTEMTPSVIESKEVQLEKGSTATEYEAFKEQSYEINLGKNLLNIDGTRTSEGLTNTTTGTTISVSGLSSNTYSSLTLQITQNIPIGTYTFSIQETYNKRIGFIATFSDNTSTTYNINANALSTTFTTTKEIKSYRLYMETANGTQYDLTIQPQLEKGSQASSFSPYKTPIELCKINTYKDRIYKENGTWYLHKEIGKVVLNGSENWGQYGGNANGFLIYGNSSSPFYNKVGNYGGYCNYFVVENSYTTWTGTGKCGFNSASVFWLIHTDTSINTTDKFKTWLSTHNTIVYYVLATPTTTEITDSELISQLESIELLEGLNNISITSGNLPGIMTIHYNFNDAYTTEDLLFCGVVKNSGNISLNPRQPHYTTLQVLDFKDFLSSGETLDFVIYQKTILEAIQQVIGTIQDYGFILGNVNILNPNEIIGAYSTKDKTAYDVFNYIADITQSRWTTRMIDENTVAIDFYDPTLMPQGTEIDYTNAYFNDKLIDDMKYSYGTNNYRNKQVMISNQVYSNISQAQTIVANGYQTQFPTEQPIGKINSITSNGIPLTFATFNEKDMGYVADFYYTPGNNYFESDDLRSIGEVLIIDYVAIVEGRQVITNSTEIDRIQESTGRKGIVARYETRNDATTSTELQKIGESYIKYKGTPEIVLTIQSRKNTWEVGQRVQFNAPIDELDTEYMVRSKKINYIANQQENESQLFYTYELISSFNSETEINYFDNQRAKTSGNIGEGEYISRNIDIESTAEIIFYDTETTEVQVSGDNELNAILNSPFIS